MFSFSFLRNKNKGLLEYYCKDRSVERISYNTGSISKKSQKFFRIRSDQKLLRNKTFSPLVRNYF